MEVTSLYGVLLLAITTISIALQWYVIFVVVRTSPANMLSYRYFLCLITVWDMFFTAIIGFGLHPKTLFPISGALVNGIAKAYGVNFARLTMCATVYAAVQVMGAQLYCLIYRLTVVLPNRKIHEIFMRRSSKFAAQILSLTLGTLFSVPAYGSFLDSQQIPLFVKAWRDGAPPGWNELVVIPDNSILLLADFGSQTSDIVLLAKVIIVGFGITELVCFTIVYMIIKVLRTHARNFSKKTYRIHLQLTVLLVIQLICPIFFIAIPVVCTMIAALTAHGLGQTSGDVGIIILTMYATTNSLLTIFFVVPYRKYTKMLLLSFLCPFKRRVELKMAGATSRISDRSNPSPVLTNGPMRRGTVATMLEMK